MAVHPAEQGSAPTLVVAPEARSPALERDWQDLATRTGAPPFVTPGWFFAWHDACAPSARTLLLTAREDGQLLGLLPLLRRGRRLSGPGVGPWYAPVAGTASITRALLGAAVRLRARRLDLHGLDVGTAEALVLEAALAGSAVSAEVTERSPVLDVTVPWEAVQARLSASSRKHLRQRRRRLEAQGTVTVEHLEGRPAAGALLSDGAALEARSWKGQYGAALTSRPELLRFYADAAGWAADAGLLHVFLLRVTGRAVAYGLFIESSGTVYALRSAFDPELSAYDPGVLLRQEVVRALVADPRVALLDHCGNDDPHKRTWADGVRDRHRVQVFGGPTGPAERAAAAVVARGAALARDTLPRGAVLRLLSLRHRATRRTVVVPRAGTTTPGGPT
ncbi:GNAT family N-acetyltransferase [Cellulomonas aerilata]|uniref:BioF2-like acetyltransferase domain-containing protein n=1 Tax=Cellulomonas aerilata TaxID=515326 RepID=A0A512DCE7_9CELL|nr:GNAT family N-acetyltransferase [Cellulomonas aerilata]GEO34123.1 hypothetical protein CAE01nite_18480 [Cellulomonas aerilata]